MTHKIDFFIHDNDSIIESECTTPWIITPENNSEKYKNTIIVSSIESTELLAVIANHVTSDYFLLQIKPGLITLEEAPLKDWIDEAIKSDASLCYSNYFEIDNEGEKEHPTIIYSSGSIRDDFNFGPLVLIKTSILEDYNETDAPEYRFAGWYDFRLFISRNGEIKHTNQYCYSYKEPDLRSSGVKQFDYVNPMNRERQFEMERAATFHLKKIGALVSPPFKALSFPENDFEFEASVIIPVKNRVKTLTGAINSVLAQKTSFPFNLIVIDNHSTDGTTELLRETDDQRLIHIIPERKDLGIGGCWNEGINHPSCGRFAVQLDSDDLYSDENTLQKVVDKFREEQCAMVIGSYKMVNFNLEEIPPGVIDHREWTEKNGPNNALRINGLGAPRAFYTPIIRQIGFPNVSYGEDYAVAIAICRSFKVGRIYEPIYLCRRWNDNTDSNLSIEKINTYNAYKDLLRSEEISKRKSH
jgi:hypothetical protein